MTVFETVEDEKFLIARVHKKNRADLEELKGFLDLNEEKVRLQPIKMLA